jgi:hypothetical protein
MKPPSTFMFVRLRRSARMDPLNPMMSMAYTNRRPLLRWSIAPLEATSATAPKTIASPPATMCIGKSMESIRRCSRKCSTNKLVSVFLAAITSGHGVSCLGGVRWANMRDWPWLSAHELLAVAEIEIAKVIEGLCNLNPYYRPNWRRAVFDVRVQMPSRSG